MKKFTIFCLFILLSAKSAAAFSVEHQFTVFLGPFNASTAAFTFALTDRDYQVNSVVRTAGLFDSLYPFRANYATTGKIKNGSFETASYHYDSRSRFNKRSKEMVYNERGEPVYRISTKNDKTKKVEIEPNLNNRDTTDLQTVFAELSYQYNQVKFCDSRLQVFDGKRRFDVIFKDEGREELPVSEHSPYAGMAAKCSMYIDKLGAKGDDLLWELTSDRPIYFWIMTEPETRRPFIARILVEDTPLGRLEVYTRKIVVKD